MVRALRLATKRKLWANLGNFLKDMKNIPLGRHHQLGGGVAGPETRWMLLCGRLFRVMRMRKRWAHLGMLLNQIKQQGRA